MPNRVSIVATVKDNVSADLDRIRGKFDSLGKGAASSMAVGKLGADALEFGVQGAAQAIVGFASDSIRAASDLSESVSKSKVIFGDSADAMEHFGEQAAESMGLSKRAAIEAGATFGNFFVGLGQGQAKAEQMSEKMVKLAGDLASFNNLDPTDVLEKLRSGLTGEAEPLRSVGVFLNEAKVKAKAMELGLADANGEVSDGAKVLARYQVILDETTTAQGDFARTSDGLANSQRKANAELEDAKAKFGAALVPADQLWTSIQAKGLVSLAELADGIHDAGYETAGFLQRLIDLKQFAGGDYFGNLLGGKPSAAEARDNLNSILPPSLRQDLKTVGDGFGDLSGDLKQASASAGSLDSAALRVGGPHGSIHQLDSNAGFARGSLSSMADAMTDASEKASDLESDIHDLADAIVEDLYGDTIRAGKEADLKGQIHDLSVELAKTTDKQKALELKGQIAELRGELFNLHLEEAASKGPQAAIDYLKTIKTKSADAKAEIQKLIDKYRALLALPSSTVGPMIRVSGTGGTIGGRAKGGPVSPGETVLVGEEGPELLEMGASRGNVIPLGAGLTGGLSRIARGLAGGTDGGAAPAAAAVIVHVYLPNAFGMTPGEGEKLGRLLEPHITAAQQRAGHLAAAKAF